MVRRTSVSETPIGPTDPQQGIERLSWADRPLDKIPDYEQQLSWPDEDDNTSSANSRLFAVTEATDKLLQDSFSKGVPNTTGNHGENAIGTQNVRRYEYQNSIRW